MNTFLNDLYHQYAHHALPEPQDWRVRTDYDALYALSFVIGVYTDG